MLLSRAKANEAGLTVVFASYMLIICLLFNLIPSYTMNEPLDTFCNTTNNFWSGENPRLAILSTKVTLSARVN